MFNSEDSTLQNSSNVPTNPPWESISNNNVQIEEYYPYITTVHIVSPTREIINTIVLGEHPYILFHDTEYILVPVNFSDDAWIGSRLDSTTYDRVLDQVISNKQKTLNEMTELLFRYDKSDEISQHDIHQPVQNKQKIDKLNLANFIKDDLKKNIDKFNTLCSCHLSTSQIRLQPLHSIPAYSVDEGLDFVDLAYSGHNFSLMKYTPVVDWMNSTCITPINIPNPHVEINREDLGNLLKDENEQIKYKKWCEQQMDTMMREVYKRMKAELNE